MPESKPVGTSAFVAIGFVALIAVVLAIAPAPSPTAPVAEQTPLSACLIAQEFITRELKAPASAVFSDCFEKADTAEMSPGVWLANGTVDAQNSFGAKLRKTYRIEMQYLGNKQWKSLNIAIR